MFGLQVQELLIILLILVILFGSSRLASLGSGLGRSIRDFRRAVRDDEPSRSAATRAAVRDGRTGTTSSTID